MPASAAFVVVGFCFFITMAAAGSPSPLYVVYEDSWQFPVVLLTVAFAIYTFGLLASLLVFGSLSDHLGRRRVMIGAIIVNIVAMAVFAVASSIEWVIVARLIQGVATGAATSTFSAALVDLAPAANKARGALVGTVAGPAGLAVGALLTGIGVVFWVGVTTVVFVVLAVVMGACIVAIVFVPETIAPVSGALRSLRPSVSVPPSARRAFVGVVPAQVAGWMLAGLFLGLVPLIIRDVLGVHSGILNGLGVFSQTAATSVGGLLLGRLSGRRSTLIGCIALAVGAATLVVSILLASFPILIIGGLVSGFGVGGAYSGSLRVLAPLAAARQRAGLFAASYVVAYLAFGLPSLVGGFFVDRIGLLGVAAIYVGVVSVLALVGAVRQSRAPHAQAGSTPAPSTGKLKETT